MQTRITKSTGEELLMNDEQLAGWLATASNAERRSVRINWENPMHEERVLMMAGDEFALGV